MEPAGAAATQWVGPCTLAEGRLSFPPRCFSRTPWQEEWEADWRPGLVAWAAGGNGLGGSLAITGGSVRLVGDNLKANIAVGGNGANLPNPGSISGQVGAAGAGYGGGFYVSGAAVTVRSSRSWATRPIQGTPATLPTDMAAPAHKARSRRAAACTPGQHSVPIDASTFAATVNNADSNNDGFNNYSMN